MNRLVRYLVTLARAFHKYPIGAAYIDRIAGRVSLFLLALLNAGLWWLAR